MLKRCKALATIGLLASLSAACATEKPTPTELQTDRIASDSYQAYARGDCETVRSLTDPEALESWPFNERRHSMYLIHAFCHELDGETEAARDIYRMLVLEAPTSFAADDAAERTRILRLMETDPGFAERAEAARERVGAKKRRRTPTERTPVEFPPLARATGIEGYAVVDFRITQRGTTEDPVIVDSSPPFLFDGAVLRAVRQWEYLRESSDDGDDRQLLRIRFKRDGDEGPMEENEGSDSHDEDRPPESGAID